MWGEITTKTQRISRELRGLREWGASRTFFAPHSRNPRNSRLILGSPTSQYLVLSLFFSAWRSTASAIRRSISSEYGIPEASHSLGYMLIVVKPGSVLISFT